MIFIFPLFTALKLDKKNVRKGCIADKKQYLYFSQRFPTLSATSAFKVTNTW